MLAGERISCMLKTVNVDEIKRGIASLSPTEQGEVTAFLFHLRHNSDSGYQEHVSARLADRDPSHWLSPEEFERRLDQK